MEEPVVIHRRAAEHSEGEPIPPPFNAAVQFPTNHHDASHEDSQQTVQFFGRGKILDLGRNRLREPLVYATLERLRRPFDASLIECGLPIAPAGTIPDGELPYWPSFRDATPAQRACYLDWLIDGRKSPETPLGYVFIYFYGLERRVLVDRHDHEVIVTEILRLLPIYSHSNSFRGYATSFLWRAVYEGIASGRLSHGVLEAAVRATSRWHDDDLALALACFSICGGVLPTEIAMIVVRQDPRVPTSVVVRRQAAAFVELFTKRYQALEGGGLSLRSAKRNRAVPYRPASGTLSRELGQQFLTAKIPDVVGLPSQFETLRTIWSECISALKDFDRAQRASGGQPMTSAMYEALPEDLRTDDHPELDAWLVFWRRYETEDGPPLIPVSELASLKGFAASSKLTKRQSLAICSTADALGFGIEPDARLSGKSYDWDSQVAVFILDEPAAKPLHGYQAAAALLELGMSVAAADGQVDSAELAHIEHHLEHSFDLGADGAKRLGCLRHLLLHSRKPDTGVLRSLVQLLVPEQRRSVGEFLVAIAAIDQVVTPTEAKALRRIYRSLELDPAELDRLLVSDESPAQRASTDPAPGPFRLDAKRIAAITQDTREVAAILERAMLVCDETETDTAAPVVRIQPSTFRANEVANAPRPTDSHLANPNSKCEDLPARFQGFLRVLIGRDRWTSQELDAMARSQNLMLGGAIEAINEWSQERFGDWLIEEGVEIHVKLELMRQVQGETA